jgi:hypothetical protein
MLTNEIFISDLFKPVRVALRELGVVRKVSTEKSVIFNGNHLFAQKLLPDAVVSAIEPKLPEGFVVRKMSTTPEYPYASVMIHKAGSGEVVDNLDE